MSGNIQPQLDKNEHIILDSTGAGAKRVTSVGFTSSGDPVTARYTAEGHQEVAIHGPRLPFGSIHAESLTPVFQTDAVYGLNAQQVLATTGTGGGATASGGLFSVNTGTSVGGLGTIQSRKRLRYRPGQGVVARFTALFTTPVASSYQVAGVGHAEDGVYFGYKDTTFGIIWNYRGVREIQTLTVTTGATSSGNVTITLNGVAHSIAVTNSSNIQRTVWEISQGTYTGWNAEPRGATVVFVSGTVGDKTGTFSFNAGTTGSAASFAETVAGVAAGETFVAQSDWNGDKLDGTGASGVTLDPTKFNVFQIKIQYLGAGAIVFEVETATANSNNPEWVVVHTLKNPNTRTTSTFGNPSFPFTMAAYSAGSTTNLTVKSASFAGFIEGQKMLHGNRYSYYAQSTAVADSNYRALFTIMNTRYFGGRTNQSVINLKTVSGALKHTSPATFYLIKNGALVGNPSFSQYASGSCGYVDTTAATVTFTNDQLLWTGHLGDTGDIDHHFNGGGLEELTLQPGEWVTLAVRATTGTPSWATGSLNTREDQ